MSNTLPETIRRREVQALVDSALAIRNSPQSPNRIAEPQRHIMQAMLKHALGQITYEERTQVLAILSFAPADCGLGFHDPTLD